MKKCIWCSQDENNVNFLKKAHTFPQSLGGKNICENVCDSCNSYFGNKENKFPSVEIALKEILNLSKHLLLHNTNEKPTKRFTSEYFNFNTTANTIKYKMKYQFKKGFQEEFARRFKRGIYKVFLEERERIRKDANDDRFNFIREFARYNLGESPVYYLKPKFKIIAISLPDIKSPEIRFTEYSDKIDKEYRIYDYSFFGHYFCIPTNRYFQEYNLERYKEYLIKTDNPFGTVLQDIEQIEDIDYKFHYVHDKN